MVEDIQHRQVKCQISHLLKALEIYIYIHYNILHILSLIIRWHVIYVPEKIFKKCGLLYRSMFHCIFGRTRWNSLDKKSIKFLLHRKFAGHLTFWRGGCLKISQSDLGCILESQDYTWVPLNESAKGSSINEKSLIQNFFLQ